MTKKIVWVIVSCLMALSLILASCGPAAEEEEEEVVIGEEEEEERLLSPEVPKYGGLITMVLTSEPLGFDTATGMVAASYINNNLTHDELAQGDWTKGPAGTGETDWAAGHFGVINLLTGCLAESWEFPDDETVIFHIRKGVHWWNKPPVNGRELTADDVVFTMKRHYSSFPGSRSWLYLSTLPHERPTSIKALDKYTVELKIPAAKYGVVLNQNMDQQHIFAPEGIELWGDYNDWRNMIGTGPFMLTDYVPASQATLVRNPNYWMKDPLHPENQLPYADGVKQLIITDKSTMLAGFRTGKIDQLSSATITWEDADLLEKALPKMTRKDCILASYKLAVGRQDKPELPFKDIRVRQAMNLAVNQKEILDDYFEGKGQMVPYPYFPGATGIFTPLEKQPTEPTLEGSECGVQELFTYNPEKAKRLLAEAGYPDGFTTEMLTGNAQDTEMMSIVQEYLRAVGIDMQIKQLDPGVHNSTGRSHAHEQMIYYSTGAPRHLFEHLDYRWESTKDFARMEHPVLRAGYEETSLTFGRDDVAWAAGMKKLGPSILETAFAIWLPNPDSATLWWPWLQNYHGEEDIGFFGGRLYFKYTWIDKALKRSMGY